MGFGPGSQQSGSGTALPCTLEATGHNSHHHHTPSVDVSLEEAVVKDCRCCFDVAFGRIVLGRFSTRAFVACGLFSFTQVGTVATQGDFVCGTNGWERAGVAAYR
jgi:hypothetical protein